MDSTRGRLLVASPTLTDPNFRRTIVLMLEHTQQGALGVVLNRPSKFPTKRVMSRWMKFIADPDVVFIGGPVSNSSLVGVGSLASEASEESWRQVEGRVGTVDLSVNPDAIQGLAELRIFSGYAAWGPGQLEGELAEDSWFVLQLAPADPFSSTPDELWWQVFARQEDSGLRRLRFYPRNPSYN